MCFLWLVKILQNCHCAMKYKCQEIFEIVFCCFRQSELPLCFESYAAEAETIMFHTTTTTSLLSQPHTSNHTHRQLATGVASESLTESCGLATPRGEAPQTESAANACMTGISHAYTLSENKLWLSISIGKQSEGANMNNLWITLLNNEMCLKCYGIWIKQSWKECKL